MLLFNANDWLAYQNPFDVPRPRDDSYYTDLKKPENAVLFRAISTALRPYDGGKNLARLQWIHTQAQRARTMGTPPLISDPSARVKLNEAISSVREKISVGDWVFLSNDFIPNNLALLSSLDLQQLEQDLLVHQSDYLVHYIRDCDESYSEVSMRATQIASKNSEILTFLGTQPERPKSRSLEHYLNRFPTPGQYDQALKLSGELSEIQRIPTTSVLYRLGESKVLKKQVFVDIINKAGISPDEVTLEHHDNVQKAFISYLTGEVQTRLGDEAGMANFLKNNVVIKAFIANATPKSQTYIRNAIDEISKHMHDNQTDIEASGISDIMAKIVDAGIAENHAITNFYGIECHLLSQTAGAYAVGSTGHTMDKNMVWVLATIHNGRPLNLCSKLDISTIMRSTSSFEDDPSAFANELSACISVGYTMSYDEGKYTLNPPLKPNNTPNFGALSRVALPQVQKDMSNLVDKLFVLNKVMGAIKQQQKIHVDVIKRLATRHEVRFDEVGGQIKSDIMAIVSKYRVSTGIGDLHSNQLLERMQTALESSDKSSIQYRQVAYDYKVLVSLCKDGAEFFEHNQRLQDTLQVRVDINEKCDSLLDVSHFRQRLDLIKDHAAGNNFPPSLGQQINNAKQLQKDLRTFNRHFKDLSFDKINKLQTETARTTNKLVGKARRIQRNSTKSDVLDRPRKRGKRTTIETTKFRDHRRKSRIQRNKFGSSTELPKTFGRPFNPKGFKF
jgi:hypothetical protein